MKERLQKNTNCYQVDFADFNNITPLLKDGIVLTQNINVKHMSAKST